MSLKIDLRGPAPRSGPSTGSSSPTRASPRDGRYIEKVGTFNPLLPQGRPSERVMLDDERIQHWLGVGAQPTDRVLRFLDKAGLAKRAARNPNKASPARSASSARRRRLPLQERRPRRAAEAAAAQLSRPRTPLPAEARCRPRAERARRRMEDSGDRQPSSAWCCSATSAPPMASRARCGCSPSPRSPRPSRLRSRSRTRRARAFEIETPAGPTPKAVVARIKGVDDAQRGRGAEPAPSSMSPRARLPEGRGRILPCRSDRACRRRQRRERRSGPWSRSTISAPATCSRSRPPRAAPLLVPFTRGERCRRSMSPRAGSSLDPPRGSCSTMTTAVGTEGSASSDLGAPPCSPSSPRCSRGRSARASPARRSPRECGRSTSRHPRLRHRQAPLGR